MLLQTVTMLRNSRIHQGQMLASQNLIQKEPWSVIDLLHRFFLK